MNGQIFFSNRVNSKRQPQDFKLMPVLSQSNSKSTKYIFYLDLLFSLKTFFSWIIDYLYFKSIFKFHLYAQFHVHRFLSKSIENKNKTTFITYPITFIIKWVLNVNIHFSISVYFLLFCFMHFL